METRRAETLYSGAWSRSDDSRKHRCFVVTMFVRRNILLLFLLLLMHPVLFVGERLGRKNPESLLPLAMRRSSSSCSRRY